MATEVSRACSPVNLNIEGVHRPKIMFTGKKRSPKRSKSPKKPKLEGGPITHAELVSPAVVEVFDTSKAPVSVNISRCLFAESQFSENRLTKLAPCGKSYLFNDVNAGIVVADRGLPGGSKYRHII